MVVPEKANRSLFLKNGDNRKIKKFPWNLKGARENLANLQCS